jgi:hypothetical protein
MEFVTGHAGTDHISAADMASLYRGLLIDDDAVLDSGDKLSCTMLDANTAEIGTGDCMLQAHHARVDVAEQLTIESGAPGYNRNDLIVARYTLGTGNVQGVYLDVIKGTATLGDATDPDYTDGDIDGGDVLVEFPLWRIPLTGVNVGDPERIMPTIDTLQAQITSVRESVSTVIKSRAVTGTTTPSGNLELPFGSTEIVLAVTDNLNDGFIYVPYKSNGSKWYLHITRDSSPYSVVAGTWVSLTVYYHDL